MEASRRCDWKTRYAAIGRLPSPQASRPTSLAGGLRRRDRHDDGLLEDPDAATGGLANKPAKETTLAYRDALSSLWLLDATPPWIPGRNHLDRLAQSPKHHLADPALAARLLGLDSSALLHAEQGSASLSEGTILGALFEHLAALSMHTYAKAT